MRYSLVNTLIPNDWLLPVDVGEFLLSESHKYLGVYLCNFVRWCCGYIRSAFGAQQVGSKLGCDIWGILKVLTPSTTKRAHNCAYFLENQFSKIVFFYFHPDYLLQIAESSGIKLQRGSRILNSNLEVEKFDGTNNFSVWQGEVSDLLAMQELDASLEEEMPEDMIDVEWKKLNRQACGIIRSCLGKN